MSVDRDIITKEIQRVAQEEKVNTLTRSEFFAETGISQWQLYQIFDSWREACKESGLEPNYQIFQLKLTTYLKKCIVFS